MTTAAMLMATMVLVGPQDFPAGNAGSQPGRIEIKNAVVVAKEDLAVPSLDAGLVAELLVSEGHYVSKGQLLARQEDADLRAQRKARALELDLAITQSESDVEEKAAIETAETALVEWKESEAINKQEPGAVPATQVRRQQLQYNRARLQAVVAREERRIAIMQTYVRAAEVEATDIAIERRRVASPISGVVIQISKRRGEWMQPGDVLLRVLRMDVLRVEGLMRVADAAPHEVEGRQVTVNVQTGAGEVTAQGVIVFANPVLTGPANNLDYRVVAEIKNVPHPTLENVWQINPGRTATMIVGAKGVGTPQLPPEAPVLNAAPPIDTLPPRFPPKLAP